MAWIILEEFCHLLIGEKNKIQVLKKPAIEIHTLKMFKESQIQIQSYYILYMPVSLYVAIVKTMLFHNMNTETSKWLTIYFLFNKAKIVYNIQIFFKI